MIRCLKDNFKDLWRFGEGTVGEGGGRDPDFSPLLLQENRRTLFYLFISFLSGIHVAKKLAKLFFG
jgi:hypothetical protein